MATQQVNDKTNSNDSSKIYMSIDHLKKGIYVFHIMCDNKIFKTLKFIKR